MDINSVDSIDAIVLVGISAVDFGALYAGIDLHKQDDNNEFIWDHVKACLNQLTGVTKVPAKMYKDIDDVDALLRTSEPYRWIHAQYEPLFKEYKSKIIVS